MVLLKCYQWRMFFLLDYKVGGECSIMAKSRDKRRCYISAWRMSVDVLDLRTNSDIFRNWRHGKQKNVTVGS